MGRKSRRTGKNTELAGPQGQPVCRAAIYARLSVENSGKEDEGTAIANQIEVCREYIAECPNLQLAKVYEDNGWTGTVMRRPAFEEMMAAARNGEINAIVVRDLSRFARNYIETGTYLERTLPELGVRFISVKERFDTLAEGSGSESLMVPLQSLINDLYSKDISRKVEAAIHAQMEDGSFRWRRLPYGYKWDERHLCIIPDGERAQVVRSIFQWKAEGMPINQILEELDRQGAPKYNGPGQGGWARSTLYGILKNPAYIGMRVYGCTHSAIYKGIKLERMPKEDWHVLPGAHEAIIPKELYDAVQEMLEENARKRKESMEKTKKARAGLEDLFEKKAFCADCGYRLYFHRHRMDCKDKHWYADYYCSSWQTRKHLGCSCHHITKDVLDKKVLAAVRLQAKIAVDYESLIQKLKDSPKERELLGQMDKEIKRVSARLNGIQARRRRLYEDYVDGILDESEYAYAKSAYEDEYEELDKQYGELAAKKEGYRQAVSTENRWILMLKKIRNARRLTKGLVDAMVERVCVYEGGDIELELKYQDVFELTRDYLGQLAGDPSLEGDAKAHGAFDGKGAGSDG